MTSILVAIMKEDFYRDWQEHLLKASLLTKIVNRWLFDSSIDNKYLSIRHTFIEIHHLIIIVDTHYTGFRQIV